MRILARKPQTAAQGFWARALAIAALVSALLFFPAREANAQWFLFGRAQKRYDRCVELYTAREFAAARECIRDFLLNYPNSRWVEHLQFVDARLETDVEAARAKLHRFVQEFPSGPYSDQANFGLAEIFELEGDYAKAQKFYMQVYLYFLLSELRDESGLRAAKCILLGGDSESAKRHLEIYLTANPPRPWRSRAKELYADVLYQDGELLKAQQGYKEIISGASSLEEASPGCFLKIAAIYENRGDYKAALQAYRQFLNIFPNAIRKPLVEQKMTNLASVLKIDLSLNARPHLIEAGLFESKQDAMRLVGRLKKLGYQAYLVTRTLDHSEFLSVRLGPYESRDSALAAAGRLSKELGLEVTLLPHGGLF